MSTEHKLGVLMWVALAAAAAGVVAFIWGGDVRWGWTALVALALAAVFAFAWFVVGPSELEEEEER